MTSLNVSMKAREDLSGVTSSERVTALALTLSEASGRDRARKCRDYPSGPRFPIVVVLLRRIIA